ncbi:MAG: hypothetical protein GXP59_05120 [Deltaproteobacteria bacterium]|nr:hypothetical protein [Deltaproteobacteria bacterium]
MKRTLQALTIMAVSLVVMLLTLSISSRVLGHHNVRLIFSTAQADDDHGDINDNDHEGDDDHGDINDNDHEDDHEDGDINDGGHHDGGHDHGGSCGGHGNGSGHGNGNDNAPPDNASSYPASQQQKLKVLQY